MAESESLIELEEASENASQAVRGTNLSLAELGRASETTDKALAHLVKDMSGLERGMRSGLKGAFEDLVFEGGKLSDVLKDAANSVVRSTYNAAVNPAIDGIAGSLSSDIGDFVGGLFGFANGGSFSQGRVMPFANGGVVNGPVTFPMRGGTGLMGEAGPEAIMPLTRGADGKLGVRSAGGGRPVSVVMNISTPDAQSFQRSQGQIAAQMARALNRGNRNR
ncbi:phage tail tape measure protein [Tropicibacter sp. Alg240-R139]|uniref:phage tail tape measure protein n=1 Tax=Tropicibacter sp. Alg240-R139 TaxID=2305991 RepID=UPI0013DF4A4C|nr:phage tail tape measure protein [Tropicibacter sp. Alg240-R139]